MTFQKILPHLDDLGMSYGSVVAWSELRKAGSVTSASVMVPGVQIRVSPS